MTNEEAVKALEAITHDDEEIAHRKADDILLAVVHPAVAQAYSELKSRVGFWYA